MRENIFGKGKLTASASAATELWELSANMAVRELAFESAVNLIADTLSVCEFRTFQLDRKTSKLEEVKGDEYYLWNLEPNRNQNSSQFLKKLIRQLYWKNEALVVSGDDGRLYVADSFEKKDMTIFDNIFSQVTVDDFTFKRNFKMDEVLFFSLNSKDVKSLVDSFSNDYSLLLEYAKKAYKKSRGQKGVLSISARAQGAPDFEERLQQMMNDRFKPYFDADSAVLPLTDGYSWEEQSSKTYSTGTTRDIKAQVDDIFIFTARALGVPPVLLLGENIDTTKATDQLLTFCIKPLAKMISKEINRKRYSKEEFLKGARVQIETKAVKHIELLDVATSVNSLISSGTVCIDEIRRILEEEPLGTDFGKTHFVTKNYATADEAIATDEG